MGTGGLQTVTDQGQDGKFLPGNRVGKRFQPGQSGNPAGRPLTILGELERMVRSGARTREERKALAGHMAEKVKDLIAAGDVRIILEVWNRLEGKVQENVNLTVEVARQYAEVVFQAALRETNDEDLARRIVLRAAEMARQKS